VQTSPLISIIVPCYNQGSFISETLDSVMAQSYANWECLVINDGSSDNSELIVQEYATKENRIKCIKQKNGGLSNARNCGIKIAKGDFIQLLDADDLVEENKLKNSVELYLTGNLGDKVIVYSSMRYFEHNNPAALKILGRQDFIAHVELKQEDELISQQELLRLRNPFVISAPLYPSCLFSNIGYFDENLKALEDWDFHIRCTNGGYKFHHSYDKYSRTLIRLHDSSMMRNQKLLDDNFYVLIAKHQLSRIETPPLQKEYLIKRLLRAITPPIIIKLLRNLV
jgi:glycosyltransferase involved in cell wall biosynthesis